LEKERKALEAKLNDEQVVAHKRPFKHHTSPEFEQLKAKRRRENEIAAEEYRKKRQ